MRQQTCRAREAMLRQRSVKNERRESPADCEFAVSSISHARRMAGKRAATAAIRGRIEWPVWAETVDVAADSIGG